MKEKEKEKEKVETKKKKEKEKEKEERKRKKKGIFRSTLDNSQWVSYSSTSSSTEAGLRIEFSSSPTPSLPPHTSQLH